MARPKAFDRDEALQAGVEAFWRQGYAATTTDDLARAMGIGRQSFYDTFGDKRRCYLEALRSYARAEIGRQIATMRGLAPLDAVRALLRGPADAAKAQRGLGCLAVNAFTEHGGQDPEILAALKPSGEQLAAAVLEVLREAKARGDVPAALDERRAAKALLTVRAGLMVHAKAGWSPSDLRAAADFAVDQLAPTGG
jgi:AcrR family transcriptional regulator